jgi:hypothetical protein
MAETPMPQGIPQEFLWRSERGIPKRRASQWMAGLQFAKDSNHESYRFL